MSNKLTKTNLFWIGLLICGVGSGLIAMGDGSGNPINKGMVITGVGLTILGIGILRYLLFAK